MFKRILFGYAGDHGGRDAAVVAEQVARLCDSRLSVVAAELLAGENCELDVRPGDVETPRPTTVSPSHSQFFAAAERAVYPLGRAADWA